MSSFMTNQVGMIWACLLLAILLTSLSIVIDKNTLRDKNLADQYRYAELWKDIPGVNAIPPDLMHFLFGVLWLFLLGLRFYGITKNKLLTLTLLLGFSSTMILTFSLYKQAVICLLALYIISRSKQPLSLWEGLAAIIMIPTHRFGVFAAILFLAWRWVQNNPKWLDEIFTEHYKEMPWYALGVSAYVIVNKALVNNTNRMDFFYPTILPVDLGTLNAVLWLVTLLIPMVWIWTITIKEKSEAVLMCVLLVAAAAYYWFGSGLEIDLWRLYVFIEIITLVFATKHLQENKESAHWVVKYVPWFLLLFGIERIVLGLAIL